MLISLNVSFNAPQDALEELADEEEEERELEEIEDLLEYYLQVGGRAVA